MNETAQERAARIRASRPERQGKRLKGLVDNGRKNTDTAVLILSAALVTLVAGAVILALLVLPRLGV